MSNGANIGIVIVLYHPTPEEKEYVAALGQHFPVAAIDNTCDNRGIAAAQNIGIRDLTGRVDYILFSDADSRIATRDIYALQQSLVELENRGIRVGAIAPRACNRQTHKPYPYPCNFIRNYGEHYSEVTDLISSGMLVRTEVLQDVGEMEEALFIDGVDSEWCWRARTKGYHLYVDEDIRFEHQLGNGTRTLCGREISVTPPHRMFYMYRNYLRLCLRSYVPTRWKWHNGLKYIIKAIYYPIAGPNRREYLHNIYKGIAAGWAK